MKCYKTTEGDILVRYAQTEDNCEAMSARFRGNTPWRIR